MIKKRNWLSAALAAAILMNMTVSAVMAEGFEPQMFNNLLGIEQQVVLPDAAVSEMEGVSELFYADSSVEASGTYGENLTWKLENGTLTISGNGMMKGKVHNQPWLQYSESVNKVVIEKGVTSIESYAFSGFKVLSDVEIAKSVRIIESRAFESCESLTNIVIPDGVTTINNYAFSWCTALKNVILPESIATIESKAFWACKALETVKYNGSDSKWDMIDVRDVSIAYYKNGRKVFGDLKDGFSWMLDNGKLSILGNGEMPSLYEASWKQLIDIVTSITINEGITSISMSAFYECINVNEVSLPRSLSTIEKYAFGNCVNIVKVNYLGTDQEWDNITIGEYNQYLIFARDGRTASGSCGDNLVWYLQDDTLTISGMGKMYDYSLRNDEEDATAASWEPFNDIIKTVVIEDGVESIGKAAFYSYDNIDNVIIANSVTLIGQSAFGWCNSLKTIVIPEGVRVIDKWAFEECKALAEVTIPISIESIELAAFKNCYAIKSVSYSGSDEDWKAIDIKDKNEYMKYIKEGAVSGFCGDNLEWLFQDGILTISGNGDMYNYNWYGKEGWDISPSPWIQFAYAEDIKDVIINKGVTGIGSGAFAQCNQIQKLDIPEGVLYIGEGALCMTNSLTEVIIPKSVKAIKEEAFLYDGEPDVVVHYRGSASEWKDIKIGEYNDRLMNAIIYYDYADEIPDERRINEFVSQLYTNFLNREADSSGLKAWRDALVDGKTTGAKVVYKFVYSDEFQANPLSDKDFVTAMYETIFDREPDNAGLNAWVNVLENGCTRKKVLAGFLNSDEMEELCDEMGIEAGSYHSDEEVDKNTKVTYFVSRMYRCCLGREADFGGLTSWVSALLDGRATGTKIADGFFFSDEMMNMGLSNRDYVTNAYVALLDRQPDASGLNAWTDALDKGADRKKIVKGFVGSQEFENLCAEYGIKR